MASRRGREAQGALRGRVRGGPRDQWLGWHKAVQFRRLHLCSNNTRFLVLPEGQGVKNLAARVLGLNLRRLSADWQARWGHPLELAETFVDPRLYRGTAYLAANWTQLGMSKGYARSNGQYTDKHGQKKAMLVYPLRAGSRERLADPGDRPEWRCGAVDVRYGAEDLRSLREQLEEVKDSRGRYGKRHALGVVLALLVLARLAGKIGGRAAEAYAKTLKEDELRALGCRRDGATGAYVTPSDTTFQWVMERTDPASLERVIQRWTQPRVAAPKALAGDGKRIRGANRLGPQAEHWETVTLVDHATGIPVAKCSYREEGGERAALRALLEEVDLRGRTVTLDAGHAGLGDRAGDRRTARRAHPCADQGQLRAHPRDAGRPGLGSRHGALPLDLAAGDASRSSLADSRMSFSSCRSTGLLPREVGSMEYDGRMQAESPSVVHSDPEISGGTPVFRGTRVPVQSLFDYLEGGETLDQFLDQFPSVSKEQALAALDLARARSA